MKQRVLIVDDETNIRRMMRLTLEDDGYQVEDAADGLKGVELFGDGTRFDAVVLDQKMPGIDGIETLRRLIARAPGTPIVMATAFGSLELAVDAMKAGARDFLKKPLTPAILRDAVHAAIAKRSGPRPGPAGPPAAPAAEATLPSIPGERELWTVNGFFIRALPPGGDVASVHEHRFAVRHAGRGPQGDVLVTISEAEISRIVRLAARPLPPGRAFWQERAQRELMNYLFREAALPTGNHLSVARLADETVLLAREWTPA